MHDEPPVVVDWLPWSHTFGANHNFGLVLTNGGSLYIDEGKPLPGAIAATVRNLREIAPTIYFNVPKGFEALLPYLRDDAQLRKTFFSRLKVLFYAGAALAQHVRDELRADSRSRPAASASSSSPASARPRPRRWRSPAPGTIRMWAISGCRRRALSSSSSRNDGKLEARLRGPNITPGYWRKPELTAQAFDEEGFYKIGDALPLRRSGRSERRACCSTAASPRTSSSPAAPGSASARCGRR